MRKSVDLLLVGGLIYNDGGLVQGSLGVADGKVAFISAQEWAPTAERVIDVAGRIVLPGFIDSHVHFRDPG